MPRISSSIPAPDDRSLLPPMTRTEGSSSLGANGPEGRVGRLRHPLAGGAAGAVALTCTAAYALPALAGARARLVSDGAGAHPGGPMRRAAGHAGAALGGWLGIEDRTAGGEGYALTFDDGPHREG